MATIEILGVPHAYDLTPPPSPSASPVLVFIHGWLLSRQYWQPIIERLAPHYQCLSYDLRGFGESIGSQAAASYPTQASNSAQPSSRYSLAAYAQDLGALLQKLEINQAWLIGHSLGGSIALWGADYFSQQVRGVICLNAGGGIYLKEEFERFRAAGQQLVKRRPGWLFRMPLIDLWFTRAMVARPIARHWGRQRVIDFVRADAQAALGALLESTTKAEVHLLPQLVSRLRQPVYFLAGAKDQVMEPKYVNHLASFHQLFQACGNNVIEIPDCGHMSMVEQSETVASIIRRIVNNHQSSQE